MSSRDGPDRDDLPWTDPDRPPEPVPQPDPEPGPEPEPAVADRDLAIAVTSHELRTPITVIKGFADTLVEHWDALDPDGQREAVRVIGQRADELAKLVDRLLATTTAPPGAQVLAPFDLVHALHETVDGLPAELRDRLRATLPSGLSRTSHLPKAYGDRGSLATVLTELVTNAAKYSRHEVDLYTAVDERTVAFQVADRGIGIAPEHVEHAFVRYWQAESGDRREFAGAGLGLYLVRRIVERQHGSVSLRPRDHGGTVAEVRLLRADIAVAPPDAEEA